VSEAGRDTFPGTTTTVQGLTRPTNPPWLAHTHVRRRCAVIISGVKQHSHPTELVGGAGRYDRGNSGGAVVRALESAARCADSVAASAALANSWSRVRRKLAGTPPRGRASWKSVCPPRAHRSRSVLEVEVEAAGKGAHASIRLQEGSPPGCDSQRKILFKSWEKVTSPKEL
jgi:hypothetical protein